MSNISKVCFIKTHLQFCRKAYHLTPASGFIRCTNTATSLACFMHLVANATDLTTHVIYTDFLKACDRISHYTLLSKFSFYKLNISLVELLRSNHSHSGAIIEC